MKGPITLLQDALTLCREKFALLLGIAAVSLIPDVIIFFTTVVLGVDQDIIVYDLLGIASIILGIFALIAFVYALSGRQHTLGGAYRASTTVFWRYVWLSFMIGVITLVGYLVFVIPGIIVTVWFMFATYVLLLEGKRPVEALKASYTYVQGRWWAVFGRLAALVLIVCIATIVVGVPLTLLQNVLLAELLMTFFIAAETPILMGYIYLMYKDISTHTQAKHVPESLPE